MRLKSSFTLGAPQKSGAPSVPTLAGRIFPLLWVAFLRWAVDRPLAPQGRTSLGRFSPLCWVTVGISKIVVTHLAPRVFCVFFFHVVFLCCAGMWYVVLCWSVLSCPVLSCPVLSCPVVSCCVLLCPVLSCPVMSCLVLVCPVGRYCLLSGAVCHPARHAYRREGDASALHA